MALTNSDFVHLHNHTEYSRLDGLSKVADLAYHARSMGFKSIAITDHGNVGGWIKFYKECRKKKRNIILPNGKKAEEEIPFPAIKPIFGQEFYLARDHLIGGKDQGPVTQEDGRKGNRHILLTAKNYQGYQNLCRLSQRAFTHGQYIDPRIDLRLLAEHSEGLICSSACLGSVVNINLLHGRYDQAKKAATALKDIFNEDFFLEVMYHGIDEEGAIVPEIIKLGQQLDIPVIATNDCHYCKKEHGQSQELLMAMQTSKCLKDPKRIHFPYHEFYLKSAAEMSKVFGTHPELLTNTVAFSERIEEFLKLGGMRLPKFDLEKAKVSALALYRDPVADKDILKATTPFEMLKALAWRGMRKLGWDKSQEHIDAYNKEIADVLVAWKSNRMDFSTYFLIVWDYINFARREKILTGGGRGSGYASVLLRALGITYGPCPVRMGLIWERFLGFDFVNFLSDDDWGFDEVESLALSEDSESDDDDLLVERDVEDDQGGTDRY
jgi:DNA polymerase III subunit alpha